MPIVIKADGLAAGKGVVIASTEDEAIKTITEMLSGNKFGDAGHRIVIEEFLEGDEVSFIVISDGKNVLPLATSQDHKARDDGDNGPNTGGMGAYSPAPIVDDVMQKRILDEIISGEINILVGTQLISKGFNFKNLNCIVVVDADFSGMGFDLRSNEKNIQLYNQLSGRAGRFSKDSLIIYQTFDPLDKTLNSVIENKQEKFLEEEENSLSYSACGGYHFVVLSFKYYLRNF